MIHSTGAENSVEVRPRYYGRGDGKFVTGEREIKFKWMIVELEHAALIMTAAPVFKGVQLWINKRSLTKAKKNAVLKIAALKIGVFSAFLG